MAIPRDSNDNDERADTSPDWELDEGRIRSDRDRQRDSEREHRGYGRSSPIRERNWEYQGHEWDQGYLGRGPGWMEPGPGAERQGYRWEYEGGYDPKGYRRDPVGAPRDQNERHGFGGHRSGTDLGHMSVGARRGTGAPMSASGKTCARC
jgi:hypothetical protein